MDINHISVYGDNKLINEFTKARSPHAIKIVQDKNDDWFYYVITYKKKTGEIKDSNIIIGKDLKTWIRFIKGLGYILKK